MKLLNTKQARAYLNVSQGKFANYKKRKIISPCTNGMTANMRHMFTIKELDKVSTRKKDRQHWVKTGVWRDREDKPNKDVEQLRLINNYDNLMAKM
jgi:hypothetical protein